MKKIMLMAIAILFATASVFAVPVNHGKMAVDTAKKTKPAKVVYTCTMHPDVIAYKPGKCPKPGCGMTLVKKADAKMKSAAKMKM